MIALILLAGLPIAELEVTESLHEESIEWTEVISFEEPDAASRWGFYKEQKAPPKGLHDYFFVQTDCVNKKLQGRYFDQGLVVPQNTPALIQPRQENRMPRFNWR